MSQSQDGTRSLKTEDRMNLEADLNMPLCRNGTHIFPLFKRHDILVDAPCDLADMASTQLCALLMF